MRFLRIIFWGGLIVGGALFFYNRSNVDFDFDEKEYEEVEMASTNWSDLRGFDRVDLKGGYKVVIHPGADSYVEAEGPEEALQHLKAHMDGGELHVKMEEQWFKRFNEKITLHIYADELSSIDVSGAVDMRSETVLKGESLDIDVSGAGKINLNVEVNELDAEISGAGQYIMAGTAREASFETSGAGEVKAFDLVCESVEVEISGAGSAQVHATQKLKTQISGAGSVVYDGDPSQIDQRVSGAGSVRKR